jgi:two-component system chemotaxis response regulator CheB
VKEAEPNDIIRPGLALIAPGDFHMSLVRRGAQTIIVLGKEPPIGGHRPAVDPMMESVAKIYGAGVIGVLLTGMGQDGAKGMQHIKQQNGITIAEHASTTVVNGMPKSAIERGVVDVVMPLHDIAAEIVKHMQRKTGGV